MSVRTNAMLGAAAWGVALQLMIEVLRSFFALSVANNNGVLLFFPTVETGLYGEIGSLTIVNCLILLVVDIGIGILYAILHRREGALLTGDAARGGSASVTIAQLISGVFGLVITLFVVIPVLLRNNPAVIEIIGGVVENMVRIGLLIGVGAILGSFGGVLGAALVNRGRLAPNRAATAGDVPEG